MKRLSQIHMSQAVNNQMSNFIAGADCLSNNFETMFKLGMNETSRNVSGFLATLKVNVDNEKLKDEDFRSLVGSIIELIENEIEEV